MQLLASQSFSSGFRLTFVFSVSRLVSRRCHTISTVPSGRTLRRPPGVRHRTLSRVDAGFIKHTPLRMEDFVVTCPLVPDVPHLRSGERLRHAKGVIRRPASLDWTSFRPHLAVTPLPFSSPSAPRSPGARTFTSLVLCHAWHTRQSSPTAMERSGIAGRCSALLCDRLANSIMFE